MCHPTQRNSPTRGIKIASCIIFLTEFDGVLEIFFFSLFSISVGALSFHYPSSLILCFFFLYFLMYFRIMLHLSFSLSIFRFPTTSIFSILYLPPSFLSTCPNHLNLASLIFSLVFVHISSVLIMQFPKAPRLRNMLH